MPVEELLHIAAELGAANCQGFADPAAAWQAARVLAGEDHLLCVTGSFFIAAEIGREIKRHPMVLARVADRPA